AAAGQWCEQIIEVPEHALAATRSVVRRDLIEKIRRHRVDDARYLTDMWFQPELRGAMQKLVAQLKKGMSAKAENSVDG
ncbi:MAG: hypothetical protein P8127_12420, partial [Acidobacteriota bacterium]